MPQTRSLSTFPGWQARIDNAINSASQGSGIVIQSNGSSKKIGR